jgi:hypothetical protein
MFAKSRKNSMIISSDLHDRLTHSQTKVELGGEVVATRSSPLEAKVERSPSKAREPESARTLVIGLGKDDLKKVAGY